MTSYRGRIDGLRIARGAAAAGGFTLAELLAVIVILAIIGGLGAGAFQIARRNFGLSASASRAEGILLAARNTAVLWGIPARVVVDPVHGTVTAFAFESLGEWSFERVDGDVTYGAPPDPASLQGAAQAPGRAGMGVRLGGGGHVDCGRLSRFDVRAGIDLEAWVRLERPLAEPGRAEPAPGSTRRRGDPLAAGLASQADAVIAKGDAFFLGVTADGALEGAIGGYRLRTLPAVILPDRWTLVAMRFDGESLLLLADGIERPARPPGLEGIDPRTWPPLPASIPPDPAPLTIGSPRGSFTGLVDEVRLRGMVEPMAWRLEPHQKFLGWKKVIRFDRDGRLDARFHERPVRILLYDDSPDPDRPLTAAPTVVAIDFSRTFEEWLRASGREFEGLSEEAEEARLESGLSSQRRIEIIIDRIGAVRTK